MIRKDLATADTSDLARVEVRSETPRKDENSEHWKSQKWDSAA